MPSARLILTNSLIYSFSTLLSKAASFLLLPIFTYYLSKEDYGLIGVITSVTTIVSTYIGLNPSLFLMVKARQQGDQFAKYVYNSIVLTALSFICVLFIIILFANYLFPTELRENRWVLIMIAIYSLCNTNIRILDIVYQIEKKAFHSSLLQSLQSFLSLGLALLLVLRFSFHWEGIYFADFSVTVILSILSLFLLFKKKLLTISYDGKIIKELIHYLFPLTFHVIGFVVIGSVDKLFISKIMGLESVGVYNIACTVGIVIGVMHDSLLKAWNPFFFEEIHRNNIAEKIKIMKFIYLYFAFSLICAGIFILVTPFIFQFFIDKKFNEAIPLIPLITLGFTILGMRNIVAGYLYYANKTKQIAIISVFAGVINIFLNYFLIRWHGLYGAAEAMLYSYAVLFVLTSYFAGKYVRIPWLLRQV